MTFWTPSLLSKIGVKPKQLASKPCCLTNSKYLEAWSKIFAIDNTKYCEDKKQKLDGPFLWTAFNSFKGAHPLRGHRLLLTTKYKNVRSTLLMELSGIKA